MQLPGILQAISLEAMRDEALSAENADPNRPPVWKEGAKTFFFKGTNGRWKEVLCAAEVAMYEEKAAQLLTTDCRGWLEQGRIAFIEQEKAAQLLTTDCRGWLEQGRIAFIEQ